MNYLLRVSNECARWNSEYFFASEGHTRRLASVNCPTCERTPFGPALPQAARILDALGDQEAVAGRTWSSLIAVGVDIPRLRPPEFAVYQAHVRERLGLADGVPVAAQARIEPMKIRWRTKEVPNVLIHTNDNTLVIVKKPVAEIISRAHPSGILWVPVVYHPRSRNKEPMMEMVVTGTADVTFTDEAYAEARADYYGEPENVEDFLRCPTCRQFPHPSTYMLDAPIRPHHDAFRLIDFPGLYVTGALKATLEEVHDRAIEFDEAPPRRSGR